MKVNRKWKKQLLICVMIFLILLAVGYLLHSGFIIALGIIVVCLSAVAAERGLRCPACKESLFKQAMERGAVDFECPKCGEKIHME
ncbi:MAG: hypothetical protein ACI4O3_02955 [Oscillospiraceae bacterium]